MHKRYEYQIWRHECHEHAELFDTRLVFFQKVQKEFEEFL